LIDSFSKFLQGQLQKPS